MPDQYFVRARDGDHGPYSAVQLKDLLAQGRVGPNTEVREAGSGARQRIGDVLEVNKPLDASRQPGLTDGDALTVLESPKPAASSTSGRSSSESETPEDEYRLADDPIEMGAPSSLTWPQGTSPAANIGDGEYRVAGKADQGTATGEDCCPSCGRSLPAGAVLCTDCGYPLGKLAHIEADTSQHGPSQQTESTTGAEFLLQPLGILMASTAFGAFGGAALGGLGGNPLHGAGAGTAVGFLGGLVFAFQKLLEELAAMARRSDAKRDAKRLGDTKGFPKLQDACRRRDAACLAAGLHSRNAGERIAAAKLLRALGSQAAPAVPDLAAILVPRPVPDASPSGKTARGAACRLCGNRLTGRDRLYQGIITDVCSACGSPEQRRCLLDAAAMALGAIGPAAKSAVPALLEVVKREDKWLALTVMDAIKKIDPSSVPPIPDGAADADRKQHPVGPATRVTNVGAAAASRAVGNAARRCTYCGEEILTTAEKCPHCRESLDVSDTAKRGSSQRLPASAFRKLAPHRGGTILAIGVLSFFCAGIVLGPMAWVMGRHDLLEMEQGRMDPAGQGMTQAGKVCGMIVTIGAISLTVLLMCLFVVAGLSR